MPNYRRASVPGGTWFFTLVTYQRHNILCNDDIRLALREAIQTVRTQHPFSVDAWILLPDHLHCIWTLPAGDRDFSIRWAKIKRFVTQHCRAAYPPQGPVMASKRRRNEGTLWQRRFWEHTVRDDQDLTHCLDYLHWNPVKHGYVNRVADWPYSTFHRFVNNGIYPQDWGGAVNQDADEKMFGE